ncbi:MAG: DUF3187 family protein [Pseudomonadota bacterium]
MNPARLTNRRSAALLLVLLFAGNSAAADVLFDDDNGPLTGIFGVPDASEGAVFLAPAKSEWSLMTMMASHVTDDDRGDETLVFDGETTRVELRYRRGVSEKLEVGVAVPFVWHESGSFDSAIDNWHDIFGLGGGSRPNRPDDVLEFRYGVAGNTVFDFRSNANGLGDVRLFAGWQLRSDARHPLALRASVKLPTGDSDDFLGSGGTDVSIGIAGHVQEFYGVDGLSAFYRGNAVYLGEPDRLANQHRSFVGHIAAGLSYAFNDRFNVSTQLWARSAMYDSNIEILGEPAVALTIGATYRWSPQYAVTFGFSEDLKVGSVPDVAFQLGLRYQPN